MDKEQVWMNMAFSMAEEALTVEEVPVGCVFVRDSKVIARGRNKVNETKNATKHAEIVAMDKLRDDINDICELCTRKDDKGVCSLCEDTFRERLKGSTLYVTCEPCIMCAAAIRYCQIERVVFGCCNDRFGGNGSVLPVHNSISNNLTGYEVKSGVHCDRAMELLTSFYKLENKNAPIDKRKTRTPASPLEHGLS